MSETRIGEVVHVFNKINVAVLSLRDSISVGDNVRFLGYSTDFQQEVESLQIEHQSVDDAFSGQDVAIKVAYRVRQHDKVFRLTDQD